MLEKETQQRVLNKYGANPNAVILFSRLGHGGVHSPTDQQCGNELSAVYKTFAVVGPVNGQVVVRHYLPLQGERPKNCSLPI